MQELASHEVIELSEAQLRLVAGGTGSCGGTNDGHCCGGNRGNQNTGGILNIANGNNVAVAVGGFAAAGYSS